MATSLYGLPSGNIAPNATITVSSGTGDSLYVPGNLANLNPAKPAKLTGTAGAWLFDFGTAVILEIIAIIHHNFLSGTTVLRVQGNATDSWSTPTLDQVVTIPTDDADGYPRNPFIDLLALLPNASDRTFRYWRVSVASNPVNVAVGEVLMVTSKLTFERNLQPGMGDEEEQPSITHDTDYGVTTVYHFGPKWRTWRGELILESMAAQAAFRTLYQDARGQARGFLFIPDPTVSDAWFVRFDSSRYAAVRESKNLFKHTVGLVEISRGLPL